jgi:hypothetical protein
MDLGRAMVYDFPELVEETIDRKRFDLSARHGQTTIPISISLE